MPIICNWEKKGLHIKYVGVTTGDELISSTQELSANPRFDDLNYIIGDWSKSDSGQISAEHVEVLSHYILALSKSNPRILNPSVLPKGSESRQALVAFYVELTKELSWEIDWFHSIEDAREWISSQL